MAPSRRAFLGLVAATAAATAGCSKQPSGEGTAQNLGKLDAVLPAHRDLANGIKPISYTFLKKDLAPDRVQELLRIINWCSAPLGSTEAQLRDYGVAGRHHNATATGPVKTDLAFKEIANQYFFISGRNPSVGPFPDTPNYVQDVLAYFNGLVPHLEKDPWEGLKLEMPTGYKANSVPSEEKFTDVIRGRRPLSDIDSIVTEWRNNGGEEARTLLSKARSDAGR